MHYPGRSVRVVHDHGHRVPTRHPLESPRDSVESLEAGQDLVEVEAGGERTDARGHRIGDVEGADDGSLQLGGAPWAGDPEAGAGRRGAQAVDPDVSVGADRHQVGVGPGAGNCGRHPPPGIVVHVDHRRGHLVVDEQGRLGREVRLHVLVEVEMVL
jgi:hypothetical protein